MQVKSQWDEFGDDQSNFRGKNRSWAQRGYGNQSPYPLKDTKNLLRDEQESGESVTRKDKTLQVFAK